MGLKVVVSHRRCVDWAEAIGKAGEGGPRWPCFARGALRGAEPEAKLAKGARGRGMPRRGCPKLWGDVEVGVGEASVGCSVGCIRGVRGCLLSEASSVCALERGSGLWVEQTGYGWAFGARGLRVLREGGPKARGAFGSLAKVG